MSSVYAEAIDHAGPAAPWLVMVHGMSQDSRVFSAQIPEFQRRFRLLLIDLPGHGRSSDVPGPYGHAELTAAVEATLDASAIERCHFWGTHTGTAVALLLADRSPDRLASLVLEGAVLPGRAMESVTEMFARTQSAARDGGLNRARKVWFEEAAWFAVMRRHPDQCRLQEHWRMVEAFSGRPWLEAGQPAPVVLTDEALSSIRAPTLLYNGEHDLPDFLQAATKLEDLLPNVRREAIPGAGGFPAWEFPDRVNERVLDFLKSAANDEDRDHGRTRS